jgi:hypothetical protein
LPESNRAAGGHTNGSACTEAGLSSTAGPCRCSRLQGWSLALATRTVLAVTQGHAQPSAAYAWTSWVARFSCYFASVRAIKLRHVWMRIAPSIFELPSITRRQLFANAAIAASRVGS